MQNNKRLLLRGLAFLLVLFAAVWSVQGIFGVDSTRSYENEHGFLQEKSGSLDAVYIGGSNVHAFWQPLIGWYERGIAVWNYSMDSMPMAAVKYLITEARKTQPQALFIVSLNSFKKTSTEGSLVTIHRIVDYQPFSLNKVEMVNELTEGTEFTGLDKLEFYFPIIRFHSRWDSLGKWIFGAVDTDYKSSMYHNNFRNGVSDLSKAFKYTDARKPLTEDVENVMNELLDYCDSENINVLFIKVPQAISTKELGRLNTLEDMAVARGYPCLDLMENKDEVGMEMRTDYYNNNHTNIHGSLKICHYLGNYLVEHYGFTDKRGLEGWESWDEASAAYVDNFSNAALPFEFESCLRDYSLDIPVPETPKVDGQSITLSWEPSYGADGYEIYYLCPSKDNHWQLAASVDGDALSYVHSGLYPQAKYHYRVVPFRLIDGERAYGNFRTKSVSGTTGGTA